MATKRRQRFFSAESTPTISGTGRLPGSVSRRSANRIPNQSRRWCSRAVLEVSEAATAALNSATPSGRVVPQRQTNEGDARRCGLATPRQDGQHACDVVAEFVHEVWSGIRRWSRS
jgi:hypothetical protein